MQAQTHEPTTYRRVSPYNPARHEITPYQLFDMARSRRSALRGANEKDFIILSFVDMNRNPMLRQSWFNCITAWCSGDINHVELSFPSTDVTATVTLSNGSRSVTGKIFRDHYVHFLIEVGAKKEAAARALLMDGSMGREYDMCGLFDGMCCGWCSCENPERETCNKLVVRMLQQSRIISDSMEYSTPQQLFNAVLHGADSWHGYRTWFIEPLYEGKNAYGIELL